MGAGVGGIGAGVGGIGVGAIGAGVAVACSSSVTVTVPTINGWTVQKYGNEPVSSKVNEKLPPWLKIPLSHTPEGAGESPDVDVCGAVSRLCHTTVVPVWMFRSSSVKLMMSEFIVCPIGPGVLVGAAAGVAVGGTCVAVGAAGAGVAAGTTVGELAAGCGPGVAVGSGAGVAVGAGMAVGV